VVAAPSTSTPAPLEAGHGALDVQSEPPGANVFVEGELMAEVTPTTLHRLPFGRSIHVRVSRNGFEPYNADVTLTSQRPRDRVAARLVPATFTLHLGIDAPDTALWIDGKFTSARTITGLAVDQDHRLAVSAPGRIGKIVMFRSEQGGEKRLDLKLDPVRNSR
jgi:serine/threonine-protein kinase